MKKVFLSLIVLLAGFCTNAQIRKITTTIHIDTPVHGEYHVLLPRSNFYTAYTITNVGPDTIQVGDTLKIHDSRSPFGKTFSRSYGVKVAPGGSLKLNHIVDGPTWPVYFDTAYDASYPYPITDKVTTLFDAEDKNVETPATRKVYTHPFKKAITRDSSRYAWYVEIVDIVPQLPEIPGSRGIDFTGNGLNFTVDTVHVWLLGWPLNVVDLFAESKVSINTYPNPAQSQISFNYDFSQVKNTATVHILDGVGRVIIQKELDKNVGGTQKTDIDVSSLTNGVYYLRFETDERSFMNKFMIQR